MTRPTHVLFIGSTGSIGRLAVDEAVRAGYATRTLVRDATRVRFDPRVDVFQGDLADIDSLHATLDGIRRRGVHHGRAQRPLHGGEGRLRRRTQHVARTRRTEGAHRPDDRDRRDLHGHRLQPRLAGPRLEAPFGTAGTRQRQRVHHRAPRLVRLQRSGPAEARFPARRHPSPCQSRGRRGIPQTDRAGAGRCARMRDADHKTLELVAERGPAQEQLDPLFAALEPDDPNRIDGVHDEANFPDCCQPKRVREDMARIAGLARKAAWTTRPAHNARTHHGTAMVADANRRGIGYHEHQHERRRAWHTH